jgi:hypothetical protein
MPIISKIHAGNRSVRPIYVEIQPKLTDETNNLYRYPSNVSGIVIDHKYYLRVHFFYRVQF